MQAHHSDQKITPLPVSGGFIEDVLQGVNSLTKGFMEYSKSREMEIRQQQDQINELTEPLPNIVAPDKQNEWIAVLSVLYEMGLTAGCTKKEFMQRMAVALGCPGITDNSRQMNKFKLTAFKYGEFFDAIQDTAKKLKKQKLITITKTTDRLFFLQKNAPTPRRLSNLIQKFVLPLHRISRTSGSPVYCF